MTTTVKVQLVLGVEDDYLPTGQQYARTEIVLMDSSGKEQSAQLQHVFLPDPNQTPGGPLTSSVEFDGVTPGYASATATQYNTDNEIVSGPFSASMSIPEPDPNSRFQKLVSFYFKPIL